MDKKEITPLTYDDFVPRIYDWTKVSRFAITANGVLVRYDGYLEDGFPIYMCLWEGWWEPQGLPGVGVGIRHVLEAKPVSIKEAREIILREAKPRSMRPEERKSWRFD